MQKAFMGDSAHWQHIMIFPFHHLVITWTFSSEANTGLSSSLSQVGTPSASK